MIPVSFARFRLAPATYRAAEYVIGLIGDLPATISRLAGSRLVQNAGALSLVQLTGYLVPLITLPYLTRVLGPEEWGRVAWMQVILGYFTSITNWGFVWSGARNVAVLRNNVPALSRVFLAGWAAQWGLCVVAIALFTGMIFLIPLFSSLHEYLIYGAATIVSGVLFPAWLLAGLERLKEIALFQILIRFCAAPLIILLVSKPSDGPLVIGLTALSSLMAGATAVLWICQNLALEWHVPRPTNIMKALLDNGSTYFSNLFIDMYTSLTPVILGVIAGPVAVGHFVLADKVWRVFRQLLTTVFQALFPRLSYLFSHNFPAAMRLLWRSSLLMTAASGAISVLLWLNARLLIQIVGGTAFSDSVLLLQWMAPLPLVTALSNIFNIQILLANNMIRQLNLVLGAAGIISLSTVWLWILWLGAEGAAINALLAECLVAAGCFVFVVQWLRKVTA
jgi:PST family polysaccharide transporter